MDDATRSEKVKHDNKSRERRYEMFEYWSVKNEDGERNVNHKNVLVPIKIQGPAIAGNPNTVFRVKKHLHQFGSDVWVPKYCEADPNYPSAKLLNFQRRRDYYQEIVEQQKFSHWTHKNKKCLF